MRNIKYIIWIYRRFVSLFDSIFSFYLTLFKSLSYNWKGSYITIPFLKPLRSLTFLDLKMSGVLFFCRRRILWECSFFLSPATFERCFCLPTRCDVCYTVKNNFDGKLFWKIQPFLYEIYISLERNLPSISKKKKC